MATESEIHELYTQLIDQFNQARLVGDANRVPLLKKIVAALGHPDQTYHVIHIAGTNGKGSTGAMLGAVLEQQGYRVGRFSSPAILNDREQIQLNHKWISEAAFIDSYEEIKPVVTRMGIPLDGISIFEWQFLVTLIWFKNERVDYAILEAGLGGLTDATNAISAPQLTIFTKIALDHMAILGDTITKIATQKSKIIKPGTTVVTLASQDEAAMRVLQAEADRQGVRLIAPQTTVTDAKTGLANLQATLTSDVFNWPVLQVNVTGTFQYQNLTLVLTAIAVLRQQHVGLSDKSVKDGLLAVHLPGRFTRLSETPLVYADVSHNPDGMTGLVNSIRAIDSKPDVTWILGVLADKAVTSMLTSLLPTARTIYTVTPDNPQRALPAQQLAADIAALDPTVSVHVMPDMPTAWQTVHQAKINGPIVVSGSFYVVRELAEMGVDLDD